MSAVIRDKDWVKTSLMIPKHAADNRDTRHSMARSAVAKFTDTTPGGNFAINPPSQYCRYADVSIQGPHSASRQMGRKYSEMLDDNAQIVHMRFGVPQFNSLTQFFTSFYDGKASYLARTGRAPGFFYNLGKVAGFVVTLPLMPLVMAGRVYRFLANKPSSKYYYLKPTMFLYWTAVNSMVNGLAVNMGIIPEVFVTNNEATSDRTDPSRKDEVWKSGDIMKGEPETPTELLNKNRDMFAKMAPDIFRDSGGIDVYALASKAQRYADEARARQIELLETAGSPQALAESMRDHVRELNDMPPPKPGFITDDGKTGLAAYQKHWEASSASQPPSKEDATEDAEGNRKSWLESFFDFGLAELRDGGQFVTFRVNHTGQATESFSTSVGESDLASKINGTSADMRNKRFNVADGNIGDGLISGTIEAAMGAVKDVAMGLADSVGIAGLAAVAGNAFVDIPKVVQDCSAQLPRTSYTIELRTAYGNKLSRLLKLWIPTCMLLAGALPRSTGKHSYTSPFLVELYDKGRAQVRLGVIDSITITRGVGNLGWTRDMEPLGINIDFTVADLTSVLHMPLNASPGLFDEDNAYTDYLAVLGSLSLADQVYPLRKLKLNLRRKMEDFRSWDSPAKAAMWAAGTVPGRMLSAFSLVRAGGS